MYFSTETLQITDAGEADAGGYECVVENAIGFETSQNAKLYVKGKQTEFTNYIKCVASHVDFLNEK